MDFETFRRELTGDARFAGLNLLVFRRVDSTNRLALRLARAAARDDAPGISALLVAWEQSRGRGRRGHGWASPPGGGVYATLLMPKIEPGRLEALPLVVPATLCRLLAQRIEGCRIKWPNDLLVDGRKLGGVLVQTAGSAEAVSAAVGFGVNYAPLDGRPPVAGATTVVGEASDPPTLPALAAELADGLARALGGPLELASAVDDYTRWCLHRAGDRLTCRTPRGLVTGTFVGLDRHGFLEIETAGGRHRMSSAEVVEG